MTRCPATLCRGRFSAEGTWRVTVEGVGDSLRPGLGDQGTPGRGCSAGLRSGSRARRPPREGAVGLRGAGGAGRCAAPSPRNSARLGCAGRVGAPAAGAPGRVSRCLARPPTSISAPFAGCSRPADPHSLHSGRVKTGTVFAADGGAKGSHVAVCGPATPRPRRLTPHLPLPPPGGQRPAAPLGRLAGSPGAARAPANPSGPPAPQGWRPHSLPGLGRKEGAGRRGAIPF